MDGWMGDWGYVNEWIDRYLDRYDEVGGGVKTWDDRIYK